MILYNYVLPFVDERGFYHFDGTKHPQRKRKSHMKHKQFKVYFVPVERLREQSLHGVLSIWRWWATAASETEVEGSSQWG